MNKPHAWVQAAVDVEDMDLAIRIAGMALEEGADWIEVGTPLIYRYGNSAIGMLRKALGPDAVLVADYKFLFPMALAGAAAAEGANYAIFEAGYQPWIIEQTMTTCAKVGLTPIFYMSVHPQDYTHYADLYSDMGARYFFTHHFYEVPDKQTFVPVRCDNAKSYMACKNDIHFCITNDDFDALEASIKAGADWITFGRAIHTPDREACRKWIRKIHSIQR